MWNQLKNQIENDKMVYRTRINWEYGGIKGEGELINMDVTPNFVDILVRDSKTHQDFVISSPINMIKQKGDKNETKTKIKQTKSKRKMQVEQMEVGVSTSTIPKNLYADGVS